MKEAKTTDILLLLVLGAIWGSSFFNIKIATYSFEPYTLALVRVIFAVLFLIIFSFFYRIKIKAFSKNWKIYALIGLCNISIPFSLIAVGTNKVDSYLAAILMSTTPLTGSILAHIFTKDEKITFYKSIGIIFGFVGILILFFDKLILNETNYIYALVIVAGSTFYSIAGILILKKMKNAGNLDVTTSTMIWALIFLIPIAFIFEEPFNSKPNLESVLSLIYLGSVATGFAWWLRFKILMRNGLVFQTQVTYLIPIFGVIFGVLILNEQITWKVFVSLIIIMTGIYIVKKNNK
ncbi:MAG: DMT family transporter [Pelagibacteraceae bacterium]|jgi:drug/metabolite transporter (DMT)-like permease|nr:DMT family transporter [Pelagibacteraceae bacterium]